MTTGIFRIQYGHVSVSPCHSPGVYYRKKINEDENCKRTLLGKSLDEVVGEKSTWISISLQNSVDDLAAGFVLQDPPDEDAGIQCLHLLAFSNMLRTEKETAASLAAYLTLLQGYRPYTTVPPGDNYNYMHNFLGQLGFIRFSENVWTVRAGWIPKFDSIVPTLKGHFL